METHRRSTFNMSFSDSCKCAFCSPSNAGGVLVLITVSTCGVLSSRFRFAPELTCALSSGTGDAAAPLVAGAGSSVVVAISNGG